MTDIKENTSWQGESREYKFRAWDWENMSRIFTMQDIWYEWFPSMCYNFPEERDYIKESIVIMQYTWMKDENLVEIYNGYIIKYHWNSRIWEVYFDFWTLQYRVKSGNTNATYPLSILEWVYVVWNIYQNPDLLSEK